MYIIISLMDPVKFIMRSLKYDEHKLYFYVTMCSVAKLDLWDSQLAQHLQKVDLFSHSPFYYNIYDEDNNLFDLYQTIYSLD